MIPRRPNSIQDEQEEPLNHRQAKHRANAHKSLDPAHVSSEVLEVPETEEDGKQTITGAKKPSTPSRPTFQTVASGRPSAGKYLT